MNFPSVRGREMFSLYFIDILQFLITLWRRLGVSDVNVVPFNTDATYTVDNQYGTEHTPCMCYLHRSHIFSFFSVKVVCKSFSSVMGVLLPVKFTGTEFSNY